MSDSAVSYQCGRKPKTLSFGWEATEGFKLGWRVHGTREREVANQTVGWGLDGGDGLETFLREEGSRI